MPAIPVTEQKGFATGNGKALHQFMTMAPIHNQQQICAAADGAIQLSRLMWRTDQALPFRHLTGGAAHLLTNHGGKASGADVFTWSPGSQHGGSRWATTDVASAYHHNFVKHGF